MIIISEIGDCDEKAMRMFSECGLMFPEVNLCEIVSYRFYSQTLVNLIILMCYKMYNIALSGLLKIKTIINSCNFLSVICR